MRSSCACRRRSTPRRTPTSGRSSRPRRTSATRPARASSIVLQSTTFPGTTVGPFREVLEAGGLRAGADFDLAYAPERVNPGDPASAARDRAAPRRRHDAGGDRRARRRCCATSTTASSSCRRRTPPSSPSCSRTCSATSTSRSSTSSRCCASGWASTSGRSSTRRPRSRSGSCASRRARASAGTASRSTRTTCRGGPASSTSSTGSSSSPATSTSRCRATSSTSSPRPSTTAVARSRARKVGVVGRGVQAGRPGRPELAGGGRHRRARRAWRRGPLPRPARRLVPRRGRHRNATASDLAALVDWADVVVVVTAHRAIDWARVYEHADLVVDTVDSSRGQATRPRQVLRLGAGWSAGPRRSAPADETEDAPLGPPGGPPPSAGPVVSGPSPALVRPVAFEPFGGDRRSSRSGSARSRRRPSDGATGRRTGAGTRPRCSGRRAGGRGGRRRGSSRSGAPR